MAKSDVPAGISARLLEIFDRVQPQDLSRAEWLRLSKVNASFATGIRNGREPGIDKIERMARAAGLTLSEMIEGAEAPVAPSVDELTRMLEIAQAEIPSNVRLGDWPRLVGASLHTQLEQFRADRRGVSRLGNRSDRDKSVRPPPPTTPGAAE